ncbi:hypothetical protein [Rhodopirellula sp. MGV]|uniref:hypothetical protein n=1 Tax=Rhodopirellula sp. MGV TaxID=2023130 RepID=UPI000B95DB54|nr:hypothetical protein [Rhodopirellula sp. MGV]OYP35156.1 hypothetical protein CGZ80_12195 [Rhodopirellula sp. MGV]
MALPFRRTDSPDPGPTPPNRYGSPSTLDDRAIELLVQEVTAEVDVPTLYEPQHEMMQADPAVAINSLPLRYEETAVPLDPDPYYQERFSAASSAVPENSGSAFRSIPSQLAGTMTSPGGPSFSVDPPANQLSEAEAAKIAEFERRFAGTQFVDPNVSELAMNPNPAQAVIAEPGRRTQSAPFVAEENRRPSTARPMSLPTYSALPASAARLTDTVPSAASQQPGSKRSAARPAGQSVLQSLPAGDLSADPEAARTKHWIRQPN